MRGRIFTDSSVGFTICQAGCGRTGIASGWHIRICHFTSLSGCVGRKRKKPEQTGWRTGEKKRKKKKNQTQKRETAAERFQKRSEKSWQSLRGRSDTSEAYFPILRSMICWQRSFEETGYRILYCCDAGRERRINVEMLMERRVHLRTSYKGL